MVGETEQMLKAVRTRVSTQRNKTLHNITGTSALRRKPTRTLCKSVVLWRSHDAALLVNIVGGECSANRPNSGEAVGVQFARNNKVEVIERLCVGPVEGAVRSASSSVLNMACEMSDCLKETVHSKSL